MPVSYKSEKKDIEIKISIGNIDDVTPILGKKLTIHRTNEGGFILILE